MTSKKKESRHFTHNKLLNYMMARHCSSRSVLMNTQFAHSMHI